MKKFLFISFLSISVFALGQIKVVKPLKQEVIGKIAPLGKVHIEILYTPETNKYTFRYSDVKFKTIDDYKSFSFKDEDNAFENLYTIMSEGLNNPNPPKDPIILELPNSYIFIEFTRALGVSNVRIAHSVEKTKVTGYSIWLTRKKLDKLFGITK